MSQRLDRRDFLAAAAAAAAGAAAISTKAQALQPAPAPDDGFFRSEGGRTPVAVSSANGARAVDKAVEQMLTGVDPLEAIVSGVNIVENDPEDMSVGYGGLPNEDGVVELDSSVMHGPTHRAGAVAALRNIKNPSLVAMEVARRTDHCLLVGEGALRFARRLGFKEENLLTDKARQAWLRWKSQLNRSDDWLQKDEWDLPTPTIEFDEEEGARGPEPLPFTYGTIHVSAVDENSDCAGCTSTSGLSWKIPGRVGDSPIIGAGLYTDNEVGSAGATGRGEAVIQICGARTIVERMAAGDHPVDACLYACKLIADRTKLKRLQREDGAPNFNVTFYAVRKDGAYGSAAIHQGARYAVNDLRSQARVIPSAFLYERKRR